MNLFQATYSRDGSLHRTELIRAQNMDEADDHAAKLKKHDEDVSVIQICEDVERHAVEGTGYTLEELDQIGKKEGAHSTAVAPKSMDEGVSFTAEEVGRHLAVDKTGGKDAALE